MKASVKKAIEKIQVELILLGERLEGIQDQVSEAQELEGDKEDPDDELLEELEAAIAGLDAATEALGDIDTYLEDAKGT